MTPMEWLSTFSPSLFPFSRIVQNPKAALLLFYSAMPDYATIRAAFLILLASICHDDLFELISSLTGKKVPELEQMSLPALTALFPAAGISQLFEMHARGQT